MKERIDPLAKIANSAGNKNTTQEVQEDQKQKMDQKLVAVATLFNSDKFRWQLDGGINASLCAGRYIRVHKDIDISVPEADLPEFLATMKNKNHGLFVRVPGNHVPEGRKSYDVPGRELLQEQANGPVDKETPTMFNTLEGGSKDAAVRFKDKLIHLTLPNDKELISYAREWGSILFEMNESEEPIDSDTSIDMHIPNVDDQGNVKVRTRVYVSAKEYESSVKVLKHGHLERKNDTNESAADDVNIHASSALVVAFHKLHETRAYDITDLQVLFKSIPLAEKTNLVARLQELFQQERNIIASETAKQLMYIWEFLQKDCTDLQNKDRLMESFVRVTSISVKLKYDTKRTQMMVKEMTNYILQNGNNQQGFIQKSLEL